jgi:long-chain fatty acid transport protein
MSIHRGYLLGTAAACALMAGAASATAGGFALREQSVSSQGASFAGNAANNDLSAMFWNPAAAANKQGPGLNSESHYSLIVPRADITITSASHANAGLNGAINSPAFGNNSGDIGSLALLGASYYSYQFRNFDPNLFLGIALNSPYGLKTDLDKSYDAYKGSVVGRESKLLTFNLSPTLAYRLSNQLSIGVGAQFQYGKGRFSFATGLPSGQDTRFDGTGLAVGATAGLMWTPTPGTTIGLGWRSQMTQALDGAFINTPYAAPGANPALPAGVRSVEAKTELELPNVVTLSLRQSVTSNARLLGTVEWSQWSRFKELRLVADGNSTGLASGVLVPSSTGGATIGTVPGQVIGVLPANWSDGWFFALGGEVDVSRQLTLRAGGAYEISPVDNPKKRLIGIPDNDRVWASLGATYKWSETMSFDVAYTHLFVKDGKIDRDSLSGFHVLGNVDASTDIVSVSMKTKW